MTWAILLIVFSLLDVGRCVDKVLLRKASGQYLRNGVIRTAHARNEFECGGYCFNEASCVSANYKKSGKDKGRCELNSKLLEENEHENCVTSPQHIYLEIIKQRTLNKQCIKKSVDSPNTVPPNPLYSSAILKGDHGYVQQLTTWLNNEKNWQLCYRATEHTWMAAIFHSLCDLKGPTVTIISVGEYIFGGYSDISWGGSQTGYKQCPNCFLFSLHNQDNLAPFKAHVYQYAQSALYNSPNKGPSFGDDISISDDAISTFCTSNFGHTYRPPLGYTYTASMTRELFAGDYYFNPAEIEVFYLK